MNRYRLPKINARHFGPSLVGLDYVSPVPRSARYFPRQYLKSHLRAWLRASQQSGVQINHVLWMVLLVTNLIDLSASDHAFSRGLVELNPIMSALYLRFGNAGLALFKGFWLLALLLLIPYIRGWTQKPLAFSGLVYLGLAISHLIRFGTIF